MDTAARVRILDEADCILYGAIIRGKGINPNILLPAMGSLIMRCRGEENSEFKPI